MRLNGALPPRTRSRFSYSLWALGGGWAPNGIRSQVLEGNLYRVDDQDVNLVDSYLAKRLAQRTLSLTGVAWKPHPVLMPMRLFRTGRSQS